MRFPVIAQFILLTPSLLGNDSWFVLAPYSGIPSSHLGLAALATGRTHLAWGTMAAETPTRCSMCTALPTACKVPQMHSVTAQSSKNDWALNVVSLKWRRCVYLLMSQLPEHQSRSPCFQLSPTVYAGVGTVRTCSFFLSAGVTVLPLAVN